MTVGQETVSVDVKFGEVESRFEGSPEQVWLLLNKFFCSVIPSFGAAKRLLLSVDLEVLSRESCGLIGFSSEGANLLVSKDRLTDNETLLLFLLGGFLGKRLSLTEKEAFSRVELQSKLEKSGKITSTRIGELLKAGLVVKVEEDCFCLSGFGAVQMEREILPRLRSKLGFEIKS